MGKGSPAAPGSSAPHISLLKPGQIVGGQFEIVRVLGRGGMGVVYEVRSNLTGQNMALKTILPVHLENPKAVRRFIEEINASRALHHRNIVAVYDVGQETNLPAASLFFTMEYLRGMSLRQRMKQAGRMGLEETVQILVQLCDAFEYAHRYMVHRDLSPENVMLLEDGTVKLLDFGLARMAGRSTMTATGVALGKAHYMSPEQRKDTARVDHRADIYAMGVMVYEMLTGSLPLGMTTVCEHRPDLPREVDDLVKSALAPANMRIESAAAFRNGLLRCLAATRRPAITPMAAPGAGPTQGPARAPEADPLPARATLSPAGMRTLSAAQLGGDAAAPVPLAPRPVRTPPVASFVPDIQSMADIAPSAVPLPQQQPQGTVATGLSNLLSGITGTGILRPIAVAVLAVIFLTSVAALLQVLLAGPPSDEKRLAKITSAVEQYTRQTGRRPDSLRDLVPQYLAQYPLSAYGFEFIYSPSTGQVSLPALSGIEGTRWAATEGHSVVNGKYSFYPKGVVVFEGGSEGGCEGTWSQSGNSVQVTLKFKRGQRTTEYIAEYLTCSCRGRRDGEVIQGTASVGRLSESGRDWRIAYKGRAAPRDFPAQNDNATVYTESAIDTGWGTSTTWMLLVVSFGSVVVLGVILKKGFF